MSIIIQAAKSYKKNEMSQNRLLRSYNLPFNLSVDGSSVAHVRKLFQKQEMECTKLAILYPMPLSGMRERKLCLPPYLANNG